MNCKQVEVVVRTTPRSLWTPGQIAAVQSHASDCAECTALLAREQRFESELQSLFEPTPSSDVLPIVMAQIENLPRQHAKTPSRQRQFLGIASKGVGIAAALGAYLFSLIVNGVGSNRPRCIGPGVLGRAVVVRSGGVG
jgi:anti-sigma factor RsiW